MNLRSGREIDSAACIGVFSPRLHGCSDDRWPGTKRPSPIKMIGRLRSNNSELAERRAPINKHRCRPIVFSGERESSRNFYRAVLLQNGKPDATSGGHVATRINLPAGSTRVLKVSQISVSVESFVHLSFAGTDRPAKLRIVWGNVSMGPAGVNKERSSDLGNSNYDNYSRRSRCLGRWEYLRLFE